MSGVQSLPAMRQEFCDQTVFLRGYACITSLRYSYGPCPLSLALWIGLITAALRWPVRSEPANNKLPRPNGNRPNLGLNPVVVDRQAPVVHKPAQCYPAFQAVVQRFGSRRPVGDALALQYH